MDRVQEEIKCMTERVKGTAESGASPGGGFFFRWRTKGSSDQQTSRTNERSLKPADKLRVTAKPRSLPQRPASHSRTLKVGETTRATLEAGEESVTRCVSSPEATRDPATVT